MQTRGKIWRKSYENWKIKAAYTFTPGLKQVARFLLDDEEMMMLGDDSVIMSTYLQSKC
jgi:hypothetical protein